MRGEPISDTAGGSSEFRYIAAKIKGKGFHHEGPWRAMELKD
jgi:hypothetical protein